MSEQTLDTVGKILKGGERRDAVHFAVAPVMASVFLRRGERVNFAPGSTELVVKADYEAPCIGVIDPFLDRSYVCERERCWMFLMPNTITGLRHEWTHPAFEQSTAPVPAAQDSQKEFSERWLRGFAEKYRGDYAEMVSAAISGEEYCFGSDIEYEDFWTNAEFWEHIEVVTGRRLDTDQREQNNRFRCAC